MWFQKRKTDQEIFFLGNKFLGTFHNLINAYVDNWKTGKNHPVIFTQDFDNIFKSTLKKKKGHYLFIKKDNWFKKIHFQNMKCFVKSEKKILKKNT